MPRDVNFSDDELDRLLRSVPVPARLAARCVALTEAGTDLAESSRGPLASQLCDIPIPAGLHDRLRAMAADNDNTNGAEDLETVLAATQNDLLDMRLREVPVPPGMHARLRKIAAPRLTWQRLAAVAALLLMAAGVQRFIIAPRFEQRPGSDVALHHDPSASPILNLAAQAETAGDARFVAPSPPPQQLAVRATFASLPTTLAGERSRLDAQHESLVVRRRPKLDVFQATAWALGAAASYHGAAPGVAPGTVQGARILDDLPDVARRVVRVPRGVEVPLSAEGRTFLLDTGTFPSVTPREFATSIVPLTHDTSGYELARTYLAAGEWPPAKHMRTEEFLTAVDYGYGRPTDKGARLIAAGALAPWNPPAAADRPLPPERTGRLLQLSVQARELPAAPRPPTYLTVGIDVTTSMQAGGRLEMIRGALRSLVNRLGGADRLTLVALGGTNPVVVEDGTRAELEQLLAAVDWLQAGGSGDLSGGILTACATAARREPPRNVVRRVVVISDAFNEFDPTGARTVEHFLQTSAARTLRMDLIDLSGEAEETPWDALVRRRDGKTFRADTGERIRSALMETLTGRNQTVASDAVLSLTFQPQAVVSYRLLGHEPADFAGLLPQRVEIDLHAGQTATLLYELFLTGGKDQEVATAVLRWRDPTDGTPQEAVQSITRGMLSPAFEKSSPQLQLAAVAAATAGRLRHSPWGDNVAPAEVLQWALRLDRLGTVRGVRPWIELAKQMQNVPPQRRPVEKRSAR
ncbi:MAG: hypothetical protein C0483_00510 [Pirellula sp.]|nr:hypothetical protein [Pirellula sp.]